MTISIRCAYDKLVPISELKPHPKNRNKHPDDQIDRLASIIKYQGWRKPITVSNRSGFITAGHGRLEVAKALGMKKLPVDFQDYESEEQEYADVQADNAIALWADLDLKGINIDIPDLGPDFDLDMLGIKGFTLDPAEKEGLTEDDAVPENAPSVCKLGDLWQLGDHRLLCGDCTVKENVEKLMGGEKAVLMVTDPPYGVDYEPEWRNKALGEANSSIGLVKNDTRFDWLDAYKLFNGSVAYVWHADRYAKHTQLNLEAADFKVINQIIWAKQHFALSRGDYHWKHEPCWYAVKNGEKHNWQGARDQSTLWEINNGLSQGGGTGEIKTGHGTQKPVECMERPVRNNTQRGQGVYDPFLGSGSTLIACEKTSRRCFGLELDEKYCDVIIKRWEDFTGKKAVKL